MDEYTPVWALAAAAAIVTLCGSGYAVVRLFYHIQEKRLEHRKKLREVEKDECDAKRRSAASEAWEVVDRLTEELEKVGPKIESLQQKCDQIKEECDYEKGEFREAIGRCHAEREGTRRVLRIVVAWGKSKGMKLDRDLEDEIGKNLSDGSDTYRVPTLLRPQNPSPLPPENGTPGGGTQ